MGEYGKVVFFITKNENGDTCITGAWTNGETRTYPAHISFADIKNDTTIFTPVSNACGFFDVIALDDLHSLTPVVFNGGHYAPYIATFNQFA